MELLVGAGLACLGIAVGIGQWLIPPDKIGLRIRLGLVVLACSLALAGIGLVVYAFFPHGQQVVTRLEVYFNNTPLDGQRIPLKVERNGDSPVVYDMWLGQIEVREVGQKAGVTVNAPRLRLSDQDLFCWSGGCGAREPADNTQYPTVYVGRPFFINAGDRAFFQPMLLRSKSHPPAEIKAQVELLYGPPEPVRATFTLVPNAQHE